MGHVLVMGRTTYDSIGRPLPGPHHRRADPQTRLARRGRARRALARGRARAGRGLDGDVLVVGGARCTPRRCRSPTPGPHQVHLSPEGDMCYPAFDARRVDRDPPRAAPDGWTRRWERVWLRARRELRASLAHGQWPRSPTTAVNALGRAAERIYPRGRRALPARPPSGQYARRSWVRMTCDPRSAAPPNPSSAPLMTADVRLPGPLAIAVARRRPDDRRPARSSAPGTGWSTAEHDGVRHPVLAAPGAFDRVEAPLSVVTALWRRGRRRLSSTASTTGSTDSPVLPKPTPAIRRAHRRSRRDLRSPGLRRGEVRRRGGPARSSPSEASPSQRERVGAGPERPATAAPRSPRRPASAPTSADSARLRRHRPTSPANRPTTLGSALRTRPSTRSAARDSAGPTAAAICKVEAARERGGTRRGSADASEP